MSSYINQVLLGGNLTADPVEGEGKKPAKASIALNKRVKDEDGSWKDGETTFVNLVAFGDEAQRLLEREKGDRILVTGELSIRQYEDKEGKNQYWTEIKVQNVGSISRVERAAAASSNDDWKW